MQSSLEIEREFLKSSHEEQEKIFKEKIQTRLLLTYNLLSRAIKEENTDLIEKLIQAGLDVNKTGFISTNQSLLHHAVIEGKTEVVKCLIKNGANPLQKDDSKNTPFDYIIRTKILKNETVTPEEKFKKINNLEKAFFEDKNFFVPLKEQSWLLILMQGMGYKNASLGGVCYGVSHAVMDAFLLGDLDIVNERLKRMNSLGRECVYQAMIELKINDVDKAYTDPRFDKLVKNIIKSKIEERRDYDMMAFCDKIELYQNIGKHSEILSQDDREKFKKSSQSAKLADQYVESEALTERGGKKEAYRWSGIYNKSELTQYFESLRTTFENQSFPHPATLQLSYGGCSGKVGHAIMIGFDAIKKSWFYVDANRTFCYIKNDKEMADNVMKSFFVKGNKESTSIAISSHLYLRAHNSKLLADQNHVLDNVEIAKPHINKLIKTDKWQNLHIATSEKAKQKDFHGFTWAEKASKHGQVDLAQTLLNNSTFDNKTKEEQMLIARYREKLLSPILNYENNQLDKVIKIINQKTKNLGLEWKLEIVDGQPALQCQTTIAAKNDIHVAAQQIIKVFFKPG